MILFDSLELMLSVYRFRPCQAGPRTHFQTLVTSLVAVAPLVRCDRRSPV
jgi:hypothetical protein